MLVGFAARERPSAPWWRRGLSVSHRLFRPRPRGVAAAVSLQSPPRPSPTAPRPADRARRPLPRGAAATAPSASSQATDLAEHLVRKHGVPFRETHHVAGAAVRLAEAEGTTLAGLTRAQLTTLHPAFGDDDDASVKALWDFERSAESRDAEGGTSKRAQRAQVAALGAWLDKTEADGPGAAAVGLVTEA